MKTFKFTFFQLFFLSLALVFSNNNILSQCVIAISSNPKISTIGSGAEGFVYLNPGAPKEALTSELFYIGIIPTINLYNTLNKGVNWTGIGQFSNVGDPSVVIDHNGHYYVAYLVVVLPRKNKHIVKPHNLNFQNFQATNNLTLSAS